MTRRNSLIGALLTAAILGAAEAGAAGLPVVPGPGLIGALVDAGAESGDALDRPARLAAAGRYDEAYEALDPSVDSLRAGVIASLARRHEDAVPLLGTRSGNPFIERVRLYSLARSLLARHRFAEAQAAIQAVPYPAGTRREHADRFHARLRRLAAQLLASSDSLLASEGVPEDAARLPGKSRFDLGRALLRAGKDSLAAIEIAGACSGYWERDEEEALEDALSLCEQWFARMTRAELVSAAGTALSFKLYGAAGRIIAHLLDRDAGDSETTLLKVRLLAAEKRKREAASLCERIIESAAGAAEKKKALRRLADLEYELGHHDRAIGLCRKFHERYPKESEGRRMLAFAARIEMARGNLETAYGMFSEIFGPVQNNDVVEISTEYAVSAAALACLLGREADVHRSLVARFLSPGAAAGTDRWYRLHPDLVYWLWRTAPDEGEKERWRSELFAIDRRSPYAYAARGHLDSLLSDMRAAPVSERVRAMAASERRFVDSLLAASAPDSALVSSDAFAAYTYFLDCGLASEAGECIVALGRLLEVGNGGALVLYREASERGFHRLAAGVLNVPPAYTMSPAVKTRLRYPVAYADLVETVVPEGVPPELVLAVMREESTFDPNAVSSAGAIGLMQLMPATARWLTRTYGWGADHCRDLRDPPCNVATGSRYLAYLLDRFDHSLVAALAAYNGGEGRMARWKTQFSPARDPMLAKELIGPPETRAYVSRVLDSLCRYRAAGENDGGKR